ncbi:hypothetical protein NQ315_005342 [Exocentrus adspersus]|uniref:Uncharacterized protein n=1 Tax=Exocentrus adspersus TaxID=1586481 RepID=A0AAV8W2D9_9CUCU|nr:hypothetical protein NQ315_005342 [Exocentrus adspersus]
MNPCSAMKFFCVIFSILIALAAVSAAPYSSDYDMCLGHKKVNILWSRFYVNNNNYVYFLVSDNIRDLFEILMQRDNLEDRLGLHQVARKSRGPQLRLRFGKRPDPGYEPVSETTYNHIYHTEKVVKRPRSLRLRFGKRSDDLPVSKLFRIFHSYKLIVKLFHNF